MRRTGHTLLLCLACLCPGALAGSAAAAPSVESSSLSLPSNQAGAHADLTASLSLKAPGEPETAKDLLIGLPPGHFLFPSFHVRCVPSQWTEGECPVDSQVGLVTVRGNLGGDPDSVLGTAPVHLLAPEPGEIARLGFVVPTIEAPVMVPVTTAPGDGYALNLALEDLPAEAPTQSLALTLWGIPAHAIHDEERFPSSAGCPGSLTADCAPPGGLASNQPLVPFTRNPTSCGSQASLVVEADSYEDPGDFATTTTPAPLLGGCGKNAFPPSMAAGLSSAETNAPSKLSLAVEVPGDLTPSGISTSDAKDLLFSLPPQLALDEGALAGSSTCSIAQAHLGGNGAAECPAGSTIGSSAAEVLGVEAPLEGALYFGGAASPDSYRLFLIAAGGGIDLRLQGLLGYDKASASWEIDFANLPQLPFETLEVEIASASGPFLTPRECGSFEVMSVFAPWSGRSPVAITTELNVDSGPEGGPCPSPAEEAIVTLTPSLPPPPTGAPLLPVKPRVEFRRRPPSKTRDRTPTFRFVATVAGSTFECKLDRRPLRRCNSPLTLPRLGFDSHTLKIRAVTPAGAKSRFSSYGFVVLR